MLCWRVGFTRGRGRVAFLTALLSGLVLCSSVLAVAPARADTSGEHVCESIGNDGTTNADICTNLIVVSLGDNSYDAYAQTEAYCVTRSTGGYAECDDVTTFNETVKASSQGDDIQSDGPFGCAVSDGASACSKTGRNYFFGETDIFGTGCITNVWAVTEEATGIQLPSGQWEWLDSNFATPHENVGDC